MSTIKTITLRLEAEEYEQLEEEAQRLGMRPNILARIYIRDGLVGNTMAEAENRRNLGVEALDRLAALRKDLRQEGYPSIDAVQLVRTGRDELERRSAS